MNVITTNVDSDTLSAEKDVRIDSKETSTPAKALQVGKLQASEQVSDLARGVAEIYIKADGTALENSRTGWDNLRENLKRQAKRADDDEVVVPFVQYDDAEKLTEANAAEIAKLETTYGDIVSVPLMTSLVNEADDGDGLSNETVATIVENAQTFLKAVGKLDIQKPVMGVIPPVSKECTKALLELYVDHDLPAYCVDFNRRSPMARTQLDFIDKPLMETLETYGMRESSLLYAVNADESRRVTENHETPGALYAYTLGFDIVGDVHLPPRLPPEVFEDMEETTDLRLFNADTLSVVEVPLRDLDSFLPDEAEIPVGRVRQRVNSNADERFRFEKLINAELIALYLDAGGGVDAQEIFTALRGGSAMQDSDLERVREVASDVTP
ncbi:hypothetical protein [Halorussus salinus]|uniref:hypothetical protein n=1 Tax=Halorussus salinus TaxID=1364935 RepID=UPI0010929786|nr:hypothetical protein [Halorussus salinus]